ncbi:hypothetical protein SAMN05192574_101558 [Mucilaginibacter gossypiicola]|uniref:Chain length determinant protein n=1 Tax=Mucilaginibacter gossypiicola TaxID=551995 RepID=A0A1H8AL39_9SPHI|nr:hypothetical protein [Mucilaginibacter gossypiicola]SEM71243.1 hypothetical protein SAMN05192574_101558 [Mucilaginibacter gossypiicola]
MDNKSEITLKDLIANFRKALKYLKSKVFIITVVSITGSILGIVYAYTKKDSFTAQSTFVLEDGNKGGGLSQYSALASLAGINLDNGNGGLFDPINIMALYKTRLMIEKALLTEVEINGKKQKLIEMYINSYKLRERWKKKDKIESINFNGDPEKFSRKQDSIITDLVGQFNKNFLSVNKLEKELNIIKVEFVSKDEVFAQTFTNVLVETVNDFYVQTKTQKTNQNLDILQRQADSVKRELNFALHGVASSMDANPNANPALLTLRVQSQKKQIDVESSKAIYAEIVKNLEISKISLRNEKPLIKVIDKPTLPLLKQHTSKVMAAIIGFVLATVLIVSLLLAGRYIKQAL